MASRARHSLFNHPDARADAGYWGKMAFWQPAEAAALSLGYEPTVVNLDTIKLYQATGSQAKAFAQRLMLIFRAVEKGTLGPQFSPPDFVDWAARIRLDLPRELRDAVAALAPVVQASDNDLGQLRQEIARLEIELAQYKIANKDPHPRERTSLQKMVAAMAYAKYGFDPRAPKNPATKKIVTDIGLLGQSIDEDTVLTHLRTAFRDLDIALPDSRG